MRFFVLRAGHIGDNGVKVAETSSVPAEEGRTYSRDELVTAHWFAAAGRGFTYLHITDCGGARYATPPPGACATAAPPELVLRDDRGVLCAIVRVTQEGKECDIGIDYQKNPPEYFGITAPQS
jgi:hypothetical protein